MKKLSKEEIIKRISNNDCDWFYEIYNNHWNNKDIVEVVYDQNWGDGNDYHLVINFKEFDWLVLLDGTYSSWDSHYWDSVSFAKPYIFTETRYKKTYIDEIRDKKIETILDTDKK